ncbi:MAG TPA: GNAT family N-acetyltransferase [Candidatus Acidoferrum sp.]|nr:GNAT family N-acetyltransferase [Candidatus Acidoferrum sp.]
MHLVPQVNVREATKDDVSAIARLHAESWQSAYRGILSDDYLKAEVFHERFAVWQDRFGSSPATPMLLLVAEIDSSIVGFACVFLDEDPTFGSLVDNLHVTPTLTGQGIGRRLLSESARRVLSGGSQAGIHLWVLEQNLKARGFYEKTGGALVGSDIHSMPDGHRFVALHYFWPDPRTLLL